MQLTTPTKGGRGKEIADSTKQVRNTRNTSGKNGNTERRRCKTVKLGRNLTQWESERKYNSGINVFGAGSEGAEILAYDFSSDR